MTQGLNKEDLKTLLEPVELGSFALSSQTRSREMFSGFPEIKNSKMWDFSLTENGDGNRVLSFLVNNRTLNFRLSPSEKGKPISATRLADSEPDDFGVGGNAFVGRAQIHKANPEKVLGTFQTGKTNMTFELNKDPENPKSWVIVPRKNPQATVKDFVKNITERPLRKSAEDQPYNPMNTLTYPLTGGWGGALAAGGIGLGLGTLKGVYDNFMYGAENNRLSILQKALIGAGLGAAGSGVIQMFGPRFMSESEKARQANNMDPNKNFIFSKDFYEKPSYFDMMNANKQKSGFENFRAELETTPTNFSKAELETTPTNFSRAELKTTPSRLGMPHTPANQPSVQPMVIKETPRIVAAREAVQRAAREREENARRLEALNSQKSNTISPSNKLEHLEMSRGENQRTVFPENKVQHLEMSRGKLQEKPYLGKIKTSSEKLAFSTGNQTVDLIALQSILGADPTLTQGDRNVLISQARAAMRKAPTSSINVNQLRGMGLGMLIGYVTSKLVGFGPIGTVASIAIGGALGGSGRKSGPSWQPGGYYVY